MAGILCTNAVRLSTCDLFEATAIHANRTVSCVPKSFRTSERAAQCDACIQLATSCLDIGKLKLQNWISVLVLPGHDNYNTQPGKARVSTG